MSTAMLASVMALAACSGDGEDPAPPIDPTDAVTDNGPTEDPATVPPEDLPEPLADLVSEPVYPDAATEFTPDGAEAFVHYVIEATNWAYATGDVSHLLDYCSEESGYCTSVLESTDQMASEGRTRYGGAVSIDIEEVEIYVDEQDAFVNGIILIDSFVDLDDHGAVMDEIDPVELSGTLQIQFTDNHWTLLLAGGE